MIAVIRSKRMPQSVDSAPDSIQRSRLICWVTPSKVKKMYQDRIAAKKIMAVVSICAARSPIKRQPNPHKMAPIRGAKRMIDAIIQSCLG